MRTLLVLAAMLASLGASAQEGRILVTVGICDQSSAESPIVWFRKVDKNAHFSAAGASFGAWDYSDETGKFVVRSKLLAAGEWELFRFEATVRNIAQPFRYRPRNDLAYRFTIAPGKVTDLGRYCAATQMSGEKYPDSDSVWNMQMKLVYMHVSPSRPQDVESARKPESGGEMLEVVTARPQPPERVSPLFRSRFVEPRVIARPVERPSQGPPTVPVQ